MHFAIFRISIVRLSLLTITALLAPSLSAGGLNEWSTLGPEGGQILTIAEDPIQFETVYAGTFNGGIFKSTDGGMTWTNCDVPATGVNTIVFDPINLTTLWIGTSEYGILKSVDGGTAWSMLSDGLSSLHVDAIAITQQNPAVMYAGTTAGLVRSTNAGLSWSAVSNGLPDYITCVAIDPAVSSIIYAGSPTDGLFKSSDDGQNWLKIYNGLPDNFIGQIIVHPTNPTILYAATNNGIYRSINAGNSWSLLTLGIPWSFPGHIAIDPSSPNVIYLSTYYGGLFMSADSGENWVALGSPATGNMWTITVAPANPVTLYAGMSGTGLFKSLDGAASWFEANSGLTAASISHITIDQNNGTLYAIDHHRGLMKNPNRGLYWAWLSNLRINGFTYFTDIEIDPNDPQTIYVASLSTLWKSSDGGDTWSPSMANTSHPKVFSVAIDQFDSMTIYTGTSDGIYKSNDGGLKWLRVNSEFVTSSASDIVIDPLTPTTVYAAVDKGIVKTTDGGISWSLIESTKMGKYFTRLVIDPLTPSRLYTIHTSGIFTSPDGGATWTAASPELSSGRLLSLAIDPEGTTVFTGTWGVGVFKSLNYGQSWTQMNSGLSDLRIEDLAIDPLEPSTIYAGTAGRSVLAIQRALPAAPAQLFSKATSSADIVLTWSYDTDSATGFILLRKEGRCGSPGPWTIIDSLTPDMRSFTDSGLKAHSAYSYMLRAFDDDNYSRLSPCTDAKTSLPGTPLTPTNLMAFSISDTQARLKWINRTVTPATIRIYRKRGKEPWALYKSITDSISSYFDVAASGNESSTEYSYFLTACNAAGCSPATSRAALPYKPRNLTLAQMGGLVSLSWTDASDNETAFQIWRKAGSCHSLKRWHMLTLADADSTGLVDTVLAPGTYAYRLRAIVRSPALPYATGYSGYTRCKSIQVSP